VYRGAHGNKFKEGMEVYENKIIGLLQLSELRCGYCLLSHILSYHNIPQGGAVRAEGKGLTQSKHVFLALHSFRFSIPYHDSTLLGGSPHNAQMLDLLLIFLLHTEPSPLSLSPYPSCIGRDCPSLYDWKYDFAKFLL
jgi:hypothetical protein